MRLLMLTLALVITFPGLALAQGCPLARGQTGSFTTFSRPDGPVAFETRRLAVNMDGAPNTYHRLLGPAVVDPGLLHICNGVNVLERTANGTMVNRYPQIGGDDRAASREASRRCKADAFALQERGFPACDTGSCLRVFGFFAPPRSCGPERDPECGVPPMATDADGRPTNYFISTTSLGDPRFAQNDPRRYLDARTIPHFVLPGGENGPFGTRHGIRLGDLALIVWNGRGVFAVFGDAGPGGKLGEASGAVITRLRGRPDMMSQPPGEIAGDVTTLVFPGSRSLLAPFPPRTAQAIAEAGERALSAAGGLGAYAGCPGLGGQIALVRQ